MVKHIVMFQFTNELVDGKNKEENLQIAKQGLENLLGMVPGLLSAKVCLNPPQADCTNYDLVLITTHTDWIALNEYQQHPKHKEVGAFIRTVKVNRACVDYEE